MVKGNLPCVSILNLPLVSEVVEKVVPFMTMLAASRGCLSLLVTVPLMFCANEFEKIKNKMIVSIFWINVFSFY